MSMIILTYTFWWDCHYSLIDYLYQTTKDICMCVCCLSYFNVTMSIYEVHIYPMKHDKYFESVLMDCVHRNWVIKNVQILKEMSNFTKNIYNLLPFVEIRLSWHVPQRVVITFIFNFHAKNIVWLCIETQMTTRNPFTFTKQFKSTTLKFLDPYAITSFACIKMTPMKWKINFKAHNIDMLMGLRVH